MGRSKALIGSIATPSQRRTIDRGTTPRLTSVGYTDRCREVYQTSGLLCAGPLNMPPPSPRISEGSHGESWGWRSREER